MGVFQNIIYPEQFNYPNVQVERRCQDDLRRLIEDSGLREKLRSGYSARLKVLNMHPTNAHHINHNWFEHLKHYNSLYSVLFKGVENLRILYTVNEGRVYLLCAFKEKSKEDYERNIQIALNRAQTFEEEKE